MTKGKKGTLGFIYDKKSGKWVESDKPMPLLARFKGNPNKYEANETLMSTKRVAAFKNAERFTACEPEKEEYITDVEGFKVDQDGSVHDFIPGNTKQETLGVIDRLNAMGCDPITSMARIAMDSEASGNLNLAGAMYKELAQYVAPKRKAIEISDETDYTADLIARRLTAGKQRLIEATLVGDDDD